MNQTEEIMFRSFRRIFVKLLGSLFAVSFAQGSDVFTNPVAPDGHDPWVIKEGGIYYYCYADKGKIWVNQSRDLLEALQFSGKQVWAPQENKPYSRQLWAPELHKVGNSWYIYVAASDGKNEHHRMFVLQSDKPDGRFQMMGKIATPSDKWAIDGTVLFLGEQIYFIWSGWEGDENVAQHLYIAEMASPTKLKGERVLISSPEFPWEKIRGPKEKDNAHLPYINEGPQVLQRNGRTFVVYSASGSWTDHYCLGMLTLVNDDPMQAESWQKSPAPVFRSANKVFAPGHASFTKSPGGKEDWIVYHCAKHPGAKWNRETRMQPFNWDAQGNPFFGEPVPAGMKIDKPEE
jgi:GH43 family beta-xylosidase